MASTEKFRIGIVGAGIGGLALSVALGFMDHENRLDIKLYEASSSISEIGAGINFWPRTWAILKTIGLEELLIRLLPQEPDDSPRLTFQLRKADQAEGVHIRDIIMKGGAFRFHRADFQQALISRLSGQLLLSHRLISYEETNNEVRLEFLHGKTATCDLLVGMDGIKSAVRKFFLLKHGLPNSPSIHPIWTGTVAYRGLVPIKELEAELPGHRAVQTPMMYVGKLKHLVVYPVSKDELVNIVAFSTDPGKRGTSYPGPTTSPCTQEEILNLFDGWEAEVQALLRCIEKPTKWAIRELHPMPRYSHHRVILGGDAAHAMTPHQGAGAGQAVEDAYILASLICANLRGNKIIEVPIARISEIYNAVRHPMGNHVLKASQETGMLCELVAPGFEEVKEGDTEVPLEKLAELFELVGKNWDWVWKESAEDGRRRALEMLRFSRVASKL
ncbi:hypothetical protein M413DRAFT_445432 [Hebeloma cylindrosporum]|uniref:FAD-binding domain-containing protein n=1 Tax=Hebeloma cylindrosporum TaxID=76867 RepID=A0A0C3CCT7_HEBCY|nr:hypothetical protein M413DRAFT_445432 [Hebeloma cylindrosporum h7]